MQKITFSIRRFLPLFSVVGMFLFSVQIKGKIPPFSTVFEHSKKHLSSIFQDKNLIRGIWQREDSVFELHISKVLEDGSLEVSYLNSKYVFIEKAGWTASSGVLRLIVMYRQDDSPGYSLTLNYLEEKDQLIGVYVDGSNNKSYNVAFKRIE